MDLNLASGGVRGLNGREGPQAASATRASSQRWRVNGASRMWRVGSRTWASRPSPGSQPSISHSEGSRE